MSSAFASPGTSPAQPEDIRPKWCYLLQTYQVRAAEGPVPWDYARAHGPTLNLSTSFLPRQAALSHPPVQDAVSHEAGQFSQNFGSPALTPSNVLPSFNQYHAAPRHARGGD